MQLLPRSRYPLSLQWNWVIAWCGLIVVGVIGGAGAIVNGHIVGGIAGIVFGLVALAIAIWYVRLPVKDDLRD